MNDWDDAMTAGACFALAASVVLWELVKWWVSQ